MPAPKQPPPPPPGGGGEPIAVIGAGCRFPGSVDSPTKLWSLLREPRDLLSEIPDSRFSAAGFYHPDPDQPGHSNVRHAYVLGGGGDGEEQQQEHLAFDADFFGVSAAEAAAIDPQQRLLLECVYEAFEDGGLKVEELRGSDTAVYVGMMMEEYSTVQFRDVNNMPTYHPTGTSRSIASNRVSYAFDLRGPSMTIDTACSSSLVAVHQAVQALRAGTCSVAVAAGTNLILGPEPFIYESTFRMLSPRGRSSMWDAGADGYGRGEGVAAVVLKRLGDALRDGDAVDCVVRETGVNQDGRTKGITVPSADAQVRLIEETYRRAGLDLAARGDRPQYFEAHGTGTKAGDPIEAEAIHRAIGKHVLASSLDGTSPLDGAHTGPEDNLLVGSIKTVMGHTEGTAGVAGLLKVALSLRSGVVPPNLLFEALNPSIEPFYGGLELPLKSVPWPEPVPGQPRRASLNSFGFGGTNAHAILESFDPREPVVGAADVNKRTGRDGEDDSRHYHLPMLFSAPTIPALKGNLESMTRFLDSSASTSMDDLAYTLGTRRSVHPLRAAFPARTAGDLRARIQEALANPDWESSTVTLATTGTAKPAAQLIGIFTGQGAQWAGMGRELIEGSAYLRSRLAELEEELLSSLPEAERPSWSLADEMLLPSAAKLATAAVSQPVCTALQILLVDKLRRAGVTFRAVVGHSSGEMAAAYAAGAMSARDAMLTAYYRGLHSGLGGGNGSGSDPSINGKPPQKPTEARAGAMMAVGTTLEDAEEMCALPEFQGRLCVAAHNAPASVTLSGDADAVEEARAAFEDEGKFARLLRVDTAYHSHHMLPCAEPYVRSLLRAGIKALLPAAEADGGGGCEWYSSVHHGRRVDADWLGEDPTAAADYWSRNMTQAVTFSDAVKAAVEGIDRGAGQDCSLVMLEIGPHRALQKPVEETLDSIGRPAVGYTSCLVRNQDASASFADSLGMLWKHNIGRDKSGGVVGEGSRGVATIDFMSLIRSYRGIGHGSRSQQPKLLKGLPTHSWDHGRDRAFWHESRRSRAFRTRPRPGHPLLGTPGPDSTATDLVWTNALRLSALPWLAGHQLQGQTVFPAAAYVVMAIEAAMLAVEASSSVGADDTGLMRPASVRLIELTDVSIDRAIALTDGDGGVETIFNLHIDRRSTTGGHEEEGEFTASFTLHTAARDSTATNVNARGQIRVVLSAKHASSRGDHVLPTRSDTRAGDVVPHSMAPVDEEHFYSELRGIGYHYSGSFRALRQLTRKLGVALCKVTLPGEEEAHPSERGLLVHPGVLDSAFQSALLALSCPGDGEIWSLHVPKGIKCLRIDPLLFRSSSSPSKAPDTDPVVREKRRHLGVEAAITASSGAGVVADVDVTVPVDDDDQRRATATAVQIEGISLVPFAPATPASDVQMFFDTVMDLAWPDAELASEEGEAGGGVGEEETRLAWDLERIAHFYIRTMVGQITPEDEAAISEPHFHKFLAFARHVLGEARRGTLPFFRREWEADTPTDTGGSGISRLLERHASQPDLRLMRAVASSILPAIRGGGSPLVLEAMMRDGAWDDYYVSSVGVAPCARALASVVGQIAHRSPGMRILEVGAGTGGATKSVLPRIGAAFAEYVFTDASAGFFEAAANIFGEGGEHAVGGAGGGGVMTFRVLDLERDVLDQGFEEGAYDMVIGSLVVHATADIGRTLANIRRLLRPGGWLAMIEITSGDAVRMSLTFGGLPGWWLGADDGRPWSPGVSSAEWDRLLIDAGFTGVETITPELGGESTLSRPGSVMVSRAADDRVRLLIEPSSATDVPSETAALSRIENLLIITSSGLAGQRLGQAVTRLLRPHCTSLSTARGLQDASRLLRAADIDGSPGNGATTTTASATTILSLIELDKPVMRELSDDVFTSLKTLLLRPTGDILWVTKGRRSGDDAHTAMTTGLGRVVRTEAGQQGSGLRLRFLDFDAAVKPSAQTIAEEMLRLRILSALEKRGELRGLLWSGEHEVLIGADGRARIPRVKESSWRNAAYNSARRRVAAEARLEEDGVVIRVDGGGVDGKPYTFFTSNSEVLTGERVDGSNTRVRGIYTALSAVPTAPEVPLYPCIGVDIETGTPVLALTKAIASISEAGAEFVAPYKGQLDSSAADHLAVFSTRLFASALLSNTRQGDVVALIDPLDAMRDAFATHAAEGGVRLVCISTPTMSTLDAAGSRHSISIHPLTSIRRMAQQLPSDISRVVSLRGENSALQDKLRKVLPRAIFVDALGRGVGQEDDALSLVAMFNDAATAVEATNTTDGGDPQLQARVVSVRQLSTLKTQDMDNTWARVLHWDPVETIPVEVRPVDATPMLRSDRTYMLFGLAGAGGLGFSLVEWMVRQGARHVVLTSRNPRVDRRWMADLEAKGVTIEVVANDITDRPSVESLVRRIRSTWPPIAGVANGAMVLHDASFAQMTPEQMREVLAPKVDGTRHLDDIFQRTGTGAGAGTGKETLDFFVLFSSLITVIGNPGQSNYAAANSYMAAVTARRRRAGLAASILDLGLVVGVGYVARRGDPKVLERLERSGCRRMSERDFHVAFANAVLAGRPRREGTGAAAAVEWNDDGGLITGLKIPGQGREGGDADTKPHWCDNPMFSHLVRHRVARRVERGAVAVSSPRELLKAASSSDQVVQVVQDALIQKLALSLQLRPEVVEDRDRLLRQAPEDLGIDSLVAVEIRSWLLREFEVDMLVLNLIVSGSVAEIASNVVERLSSELAPGLGQVPTDSMKPRAEASEKTQVTPAAAVRTARTPQQFTPTTQTPSSGAHSSTRASSPLLPSDIATPTTKGSAPPSSPGTAATSPRVDAEPLPEAVTETMAADLLGLAQDGPETDGKRPGIPPPLTTPPPPPQPPSLIFEKIVPMSFGQSDFWFMTQLVEDKTHFNGTVSIIINAAIDIPRFESSVCALVARHEGLRTAFFEDAERRPVQGVLAVSPLCLELGTAADEDEVRRRIDGLNGHVYDLGCGETVRLVLLTESEGRHHLLIGYHHINTDGSTFMAMLADIRRIYERGGSGEGLPPPYQYTAFSEAQRRQLKDGHWDESIAFWKAQFPALPEVLPLLNVVSPTRGQRRTRPAGGRRTSYRHVKSEGRIDAPLAAGVRRLARRYRVTPFHVYTAVLRVLLARLAETEDVVVGVASANRGGSNDGDGGDGDLTGSVGIFVNVFALRMPTCMGASFEEVMRDTRSRVLAAMEHAHVPFDVVLKAVGAERSPGHSPLFQAFVNYIPVRDRLPFAEGDTEHGEYNIGETMYDLMLCVIDNPAGDAFVSFLLQRELYDEENAQAVSACFLALLRAFVEDDGLLIGEPQMWDLGEVQRALNLGVGKELDIGDGSFLDELDTIVDQNPRAPAVKDTHGTVLSYTDLRSRSLAIATAISKLSIPGAGARIAMLQEPTADWICSMFGIWAAGAAYLPLEMSHGPQRLAVVTADAEPVAILVHDETAHLLHEIGWSRMETVINVSRIKNGSVAEEGFKRETSPSARDEAVVLYTSGSTGVPKGISLPHRMVTNSITGFLHHWPMPPQTVLQQIALSFDVSWWQTLLGLATRGTVLVAGKTLRRDPLALTDLIVREGVTLTLAVPAEAGSWLSVATSSAERHAALRASKWRWHISAGEDFGPNLLRQLQALGKGDLRAVNAYGPAETIIPTACDVPYSGLALEDALPVPVGAVMPNYTVYVADPQGHPVPPGVVGEIVIAGAGVANGYVGRPELTEAKFPTDKLADSRALAKGWTRAHRSGDEGYLCEAGGVFVLLGRIAADTQVKIRGQRVDLREVEACIVAAGRGDVQDAVVHLHGGDGDGSAAALLVAHVVLSPDARKRYHGEDETSMTGVKGNFLDLLMQSLPLPGYMRPVVTVVLTALPLNPHGKVDRRAIAALPLRRSGSELKLEHRKHGNGTTSESQAVERMRSIWKYVLGDGVIEDRLQGGGAELEFFDVGGNSLLLVTLQSELRNRFGVQVKLAQLFEMSTLAQMVMLIPQEAKPTMEEDRALAKMRTIWLEALGDAALSDIPLDENLDFFHIGGNSLLLVSLQAEIRKTWGLSVPLARLFEASTLGQMTELVRPSDVGSASDLAKGSGVDDPIDWDKETQPGPEIVQLARTPVMANGAAERLSVDGLVVVLTGASGFLGRAILRHLLAADQVRHVHCIAVRNPDKLAPLLSESKDRPKVTIHRGDLSDEQTLGLADRAAAASVFAEADAVVHNGADVNFMRSYHSMRAANVGSTRLLVRNLLAHRRLRGGAQRPTTTAFHYVSTAGVSQLGREELFEEPLRPTLLAGAAEEGFNGYVLSKWASERLLENVAWEVNRDDGEAPLAVTIHRPASITGPGANRLDAMHNVLHFVRELGARPELPDIERWLQFVDVEEVARDIVGDVVAAPGGGGVSGPGGVRYRNLSGENEDALHVSRVGEYLREKHGFEFPIVPLGEWLEAAARIGLPREMGEYLRSTGMAGQRAKGDKGRQWAMPRVWKGTGGRAR